MSRSWPRFRAILASSIRFTDRTRGAAAARSGHLAVGRRGERLAAGFLRGLGYRILARNQRIAGVEIDILATHPDDGIHLLIEVKTTSGGGFPERRVDGQRGHRLHRAALAVSRDHPVAIEVMAVDLSVTPVGIRRIRLESPARTGGFQERRRF